MSAHKFASGRRLSVIHLALLASAATLVPGTAGAQNTTATPPAPDANTGDTLQTTCTWNNQENKTLGFPSEMCVTFAFYLGSGLQITCVGGHWGD